MKLYKSLAIFGMAFLVSSVLCSMARGQETAGKGVEHSKKVGTTLENLQTAYYSESNETFLYTEFAKKADQEGYHQVASMFRAIAQAKNIHATKKAGFIKQMGGTLKTDSTGERSLVGTTKDNIQFALLSETYERDVMYPEFIAQAKKEKQADVAKSFELCMAAEPRHHAMLEQTSKDLDGFQGKNVDFYVCPECGNSLRTLPKTACDICSKPKDQFLTVR